MPATKASPIANDPPCARALLVLAALTTMAALLPGRAGEAAEPCEPSVGRIVSLQGLVEVQLAGAVDWAGAALDDRLCIGDSLRVGAYSQAAVALANDSVASVDQLTTMRFVGEGEGGRSWIDLLLGVVHFFSHRPRALEVDTPIANAFTEGTEFLVRARPQRTEVILLDGRVRLTNAEGEVLLASGDAGVAEAGAAPRREIVARPRDAVAWALYYPPILAPLAERAVPPSLPAGLQRAVERVAEGDYAGALAALDAVPDASRDARYHTYRAGVLLNVGRVDEAAAALERALALEPDAAEALAQRAVIAVVQNREEAALADARRAVELGPDSAPARIALSYALQAAFDLEATREVLREGAARTPDDPLVLARLAEIELSFGDLDAAQAAAARAVALAPGLARTQMVLGFAALTRIEIDEAKAAFQRAIELDSALPLARLGLGLARIREGDLEDGRHELEIAAALDPNDSLLRSYLGKAYFEERRGPLDAGQFRIAKQLDPSDPTPYFYDAIRLQTENRPVEALRELEKSIALNDNRAIYRSRLLLDEDRAARSVSLARVYDDLGFDQAALVEATRSLNADYANSSAHRFLSDTYARLPRHEIARVSELLQSQLLQPININPVQPSLPLTDLNVAASAGPAEASFNEFTPLFTRNNAQLTTTGVVGNNDTYGGEGVMNMLYGRTSLSVGGLGFDTDGFRDNNDVKNKLANVFAQVAVTPGLSLQAEYRKRSTDQGDLELRFDPDNFISGFRRDLRQDTGRLGLHYQVQPGSDLIASLITTDRDEELHDVTFPPTPVVAESRTETHVEDKGYQVEAQYMFQSRYADLVAGFGGYKVDVNNTLSRIFELSDGSTIPGPNIETVSEREQADAYLYSDTKWSNNLVSTLGLGYTWFDESATDIEKFTPKIGLQWLATDGIHVRAAATRTVKRALVADQTIEPTQVAGFNQLFDDVNGTVADRYGIGVDLRVAPTLYVGAEASHRELDIPLEVRADGDVNSISDSADENLYVAYLYWGIGSSWAVSAEILFDEFKGGGELGPEAPRRLDTLTVPLAVRYFDESGWFAGVAARFLHQDVRYDAPPGSRNENEQTVLFNAGAGYRLSGRRGIFSVEVVNVTDEKFNFQDDNFRSSETRLGNYIPDRTMWARLTLNF